MPKMTELPFEVVIYEGEGAQALDEAWLFDVMVGLLEGGYRVHLSLIHI